MNYNIFDSVCYTNLDPLVPFTKVAEYDTLNEVRNFLSNSNELIKYFVCDKNNNILFDSFTKIYESPDNGKTIYERHILQLNKKIR